MKVFLSYARKDGSEHVRKLHDALKACGHAPWLDTTYPRVPDWAIYAVTILPGESMGWWAEV